MDYIPKMLKGKGLIDARTPFGPLVIAFFEKESPAKKAGVLVGDELAGIDSMKFTYYDEFQKYLCVKTRQRALVLNIIRKDDMIEYFC